MCALWQRKASWQGIETQSAKFCNGMPSKGPIGVNRKVMVFLDTELSVAIDIPLLKTPPILGPYAELVCVFVVNPRRSSAQRGLL